MGESTQDIRNLDASDLLNNYQSSGEALRQTTDTRLSGFEPLQRRPQVTYSPIRQALKSGIIDSTISGDYTQEALEAGFGDSRYDTYYTPGMDLEHSRALAQSGFWKIGNGLLKGGVTAVTTAANTVVGTVAGAGATLFELGKQAFNASDKVDNSWSVSTLGKQAMAAIGAGANNKFSQWMLDIQKWSEDVLPNYKTQQERTEQYQDEWYKHMLTPNFIGDSLLKNFGFTVGAMAGGWAWSKALGSLMAASKVPSDVMKGAIAASQGDAKATAALQRGMQEIAAKGLVGVDAAAVANNAAEAAKGLNSMPTLLQIFGAAVGAVGEGTVEGLNAKNEFIQQYQSELERSYRQEYNQIEKDILYSGNKDWAFTPYYTDENGNVIKGESQLTEAGKNHVQHLREQLNDQYRESAVYAQNVADRLATTVFLLNLPILTIDNTAQFGKLLSGGYKTARRAVPLKGGISINDAGKIAADYAAKGSAIKKSVLRSLKVGGIEAFEEMAQGTVSSGAKNVAEIRATRYNDDGFDAGSIDTVAEWVTGMLQGGGNYLGDMKNWQEGALGALTGLFGIPGRFWRGEWNGGVPGAIKDAKQEYNHAKAAADILNKTVNSDAFQTRWHNYIRHLKYEEGMSKALKEDNQYAWHNENDKSLINDIITFADAERLEDLRKIVDHYGSLSESDAADIKEALKQSGDYTAPVLGEQLKSTTVSKWVENAKPSDIIKNVHDQAERINTFIDNYKKLYDIHSTRFGGEADANLLKEIIFTGSQLKAFEDRYVTMLEDVIDGASSAIELNISNSKQAFDDKDRMSKLNEAKEALRKTFSGNVLPVDPNRTKVADALVEASADNLKKLVSGNTELVNKINDIEKISLDRGAFYRKYARLQKMTGEEFNKAAITQDKVNKASEAQFNKDELKDLNSVEAIKAKYKSLVTAEDRTAFLNMLQSVKQTNKAARDFLNLLDKTNNLKDFVNKKTKQDATGKKIMNKIIDDAADAATSEDELAAIALNSMLPQHREKKKAEVKAALQGQATVDVSMLDDAAWDQHFSSTADEMAAALAQFEDQSSRLGTSQPEYGDEYVPYEGPSTSPGGIDPPNPGTASAPPKAPQKQPQAPQPTAAPAEAPKPAEAKEEAISVGDTDFTGRGLMNYTAASLQNPTPLKEPTKRTEIGETKTAYYRTSVPEIDSFQARDARTAKRNKDFETMKGLDLSDFVQFDKDGKPTKNAGYAQVWKALNDSGAFQYVDTELKEGDEVIIEVRDDFPKHYKTGEPLFVVSKVLDWTDDGRVYNTQPLTVLLDDGKNEKYFGLSELRAEIRAAYEKAGKPKHFVFGGETSPYTSRVWLKQPGLVDYDRSASGEKAINDFSDYSGKAPIVVINGKGEVVTIRGDKTAQNSLNTEFLGNAESNIRNGRVGNMYYLVQDGTGQRYIPVALRAQKFDHEHNNGNASSILGGARSVLQQMSKVVSEYDPADGTDLQQEIDSLREKLENYLNLHGVWFKVDSYVDATGSLSVALHIENNNAKSAFKGSEYFSPVDIASGRKDIVSFVEGFHRPVQIRLTPSGTVSNLDKLISEGLITTNARHLRAAGTDFYFNPWNPATKQFEPITADQVASPANQKTSTAPSQPAAQPEDIPEEIGNQRGAEIPAEEPQDVGVSDDDLNLPREVDVPEYQTFKDLPADIQNSLTALGVTEEEFDSYPDDIKARAIECL